MDEVEIKPICKFYKTIYKRMRTWFGYTTPCWLSDMDQQTVLTCILRLNISKGMYTIFINVAIKIKKNNGRATDVLDEYKKSNPDIPKITKRRIYYDENIERIRHYNKQYQLLKSLGINWFKKRQM